MIFLPSQNPLFCSHSSLEGNFNRYLVEIATNTDWLWKELIVEDKGEEYDHTRSQKDWSRLFFHGLAEFFSEIMYYLAYVESLASISDIKPNTRLFHASNVALRMVACWDRLGFFLYQRFEIPVPEKTYFLQASQEILKNTNIDKHSKSLILGMTRQFEKDATLRDWRHNYIHRHGEYFRVEKIGSSLTNEYFPFDQESQSEMSQELIETLLESYPRLKSAMKSASFLIE